MNECSFCGSTKQIVWEDVDGKKACVDCKESDENINIEEVKNKTLFVADSEDGRVEAFLEIAYYEWLIAQTEKVERYENAINLAIAQLEESDSIPFALDALKEVLNQTVKRR